MVQRKVAISETDCQERLWNPIVKTVPYRWHVAQYQVEFNRRIVQEQIVGFGKSLRFHAVIYPGSNNAAEYTNKNGL